MQGSTRAPVAATEQGGERQPISAFPIRGSLLARNSALNFVGLPLPWG